MTLGRERFQKLVLLVAAGALVSAGLSGCKKGGLGSGGQGLKQTVSEKAKVEFYIMSQCPFGTQVEDAIAPVLKQMGGDIDFALEFIGNVNGEELTSLHREPEVKGDMAQICAIKYSPVKYQYMDMILCMNKNYRDIPNNWEACAKSSGMPVDKIKACYEGKEGKELLKTSFNKAKERRAAGSPTLYFGNAQQAYRGPRSEKAFTRALCDVFPKDKPQVCASLPPPVKVPVVILSDTRCQECRTSMLEQQMKELFPGAESKVVDYGTEEGKKMYTEYKLKTLPVIFFGKQVQEADNYQRIQRALTPLGEYLAVTRWGRFDPTKEICDNKIDDNGNSKLDCDDEDCKFALACRKDVTKKLELFVMSQCPYGVKALNSMKEVLANFKGGITVEIHFIADEEGEGFRSLHGQPEVDENIRQLCAMKLYPKAYKFMDYILCRNQNITSSDWESCTGAKTGIDTKKVKECFEGDMGKKLLREDIKIAQGLSVSGSPTWFANNKNRFSALDPEAIKTNLCNFNKELKGCENKLSGPEADASGPKAGSCN